MSFLFLTNIFLNRSEEITSELGELLDIDQQCELISTNIIYYCLYKEKEKHFYIKSDLKYKYLD